MRQVVSRAEWGAAGASTLLLIFSFPNFELYPLAWIALAPLLIAIAGPNGEYPRRVSATGGLYIEKEGRDIPDTFLMTADYPSEWSLFLVSTLTMLVCPTKSTANTAPWNSPAI